MILASSCHICVTENESRPVHFAAEELQKYLLKITGVRLPISADTQSSVIRLKTASSSDGRDGFRIDIHNGEVDITGSNGRSVLYGVYAFLEQCCDVGFYAPDCESIPTNSKLTIPDAYHYEETAEFAIRSIRMELNITPESVDWAAKNRFNAFSLDYWVWDGTPANIRDKVDIPAILNAIEDRGLIAEGSGHAMWYFLKADTYLKDHPDWFAKVGGKQVSRQNTGDNFCYSNPAAVEEFANNVIAFCRRFPQMKRISLWPGDGGAVCECDACLKKPFMELYGGVIAHLAERMASVLPDVKVIQLSYNGVAAKDDKINLFHIPRRDPELPTMFSFWGQDLGIPLSRNPEPGHQRVWESIRDFCARDEGKAIIFSYHTDTFMNSNLCPIFESAMSEDFDDFKKLGIDEVFLLWIPWNSESDQDIPWLSYQNGVLWARRAMNVHFDTRAFRRDYYQAVFGEEQADKGEELWDRLNEGLRKQLPLIFPTLPRRPTDAWGFAFNREVFQWKPTDAHGDFEKSRQAIFEEMAEVLSRVNEDAQHLSESSHPECTRFKKYVAHCTTRAKGLALIFAAQAAIQAGSWTQAADLLQQALDTGMAEERRQTESWLAHVKSK